MINELSNRLLERNGFTKTLEENLELPEAINLIRTIDYDGLEESPISKRKKMELELCYFGFDIPGYIFHRLENPTLKEIVTLLEDHLLNDGEFAIKSKGDYMKVSHKIISETSGREKHHLHIARGNKREYLRIMKGHKTLCSLHLYPPQLVMDITYVLKPENYS